jgi:hypothetical protein
MSVALPLQRIRDIFDQPAGGVVRLVDNLLEVASEHGLRLNVESDATHLQLIDKPEAVIELPIRASVIRAVLARIAALCNTRLPDSVSPYSGEGELSFGSEQPVLLRAAFSNTASEQWLELGRAPADAVANREVAAPATSVPLKPV